MREKIIKIVRDVLNDTLRPNGKYSRKSWSWVLGMLLFALHANYAVFFDPSLLALSGFLELMLLYVGMSGFWGVLTYMSKKNLPRPQKQTETEKEPLI